MCPPADATRCEQEAPGGDFLTLCYNGADDRKFTDTALVASLFKNPTREDKAKPLCPQIIHTLYTNQLHLESLCPLAPSQEFLRSPRDHLTWDIERLHLQRGTYKSSVSHQGPSYVHVKQVLRTSKHIRDETFSLFWIKPSECSIQKRIRKRTFIRVLWPERKLTPSKTDLVWFLIQ